MHAVARLAPLVALAVLGVSPAADAACPRTDAESEGTGSPGLFPTVAPFEHATAQRTQLFAACSLRELTGEAAPRIAARAAPGDFRTPYIVATRTRRELFVYGYGVDAAADGAFVASVDARTLGERWRTRIRDPSPAGQWSYPGVATVHADGAVLAVYGSVLARLDPRTGRVVRRVALPEDPAGTGAAYNGMTVLPDGTVVLKGIERGPCAVDPAAPGAQLSGLACAVRNARPTPLVAVEPRTLRILARATPPEPVTGRITAARVNGVDHVLLAGRDTLQRLRWRGGRLALDRSWGPVTYRRGTAQPGTGPGVMGRWAVVQTNFLPSGEPLELTAVDLRDSRRVFRARPFAGRGAQSFIVSKAALDAQSSTVVTHDTGVGEMAALRLDPRTGFRLRWRRTLRSLAFSALVGPKDDREVVIPSTSSEGERVEWLSLRTGALRTSSRTLSRTAAPGNIVTPGFDGRFFLVTGEGRLWALRPTAGVPAAR